jgi:hypothetical protein
MGVMKHKDGPMQDRQLPDLHHSKGNSFLPVPLAPGVNSSTMDLLRNNTISIRTTMATVTMMDMVQTDMIRVTGNSTMR